MPVCETAVMMATPADLEDFARGFTLTERIVEKPSEIFDIEVEEGERGIEVNLEIAAPRMQSLQERRRSLAGRTGCGLCGVDSLEAAMRPVAVSVSGSRVARAAIERAGGKATDSVSKKTSYVVVGANPGSRRRRRRSS